MLFNLRSIAVMALTILSISASPVNSELNKVAQPLDRRADTSPLMRRSDFHWRFYDNGGCDHNSSPDDTWPENGTAAGEGTYGVCYSAPVGVNWNRVEIDVFFSSSQARGVQTFCNINCQGGASVKPGMAC
ncbi:uncharacterized protein K441DRAFT_680425 [Cenococcum geophilum 1.58]|uniref:uncharacterized protein n=1 Tax=Cenococcum geophilum 1.58 TaxID=794803 RepID=UPI00358FC8F8|nr:hypothetical protein K441DRAFT_680425 [Cenococcum geophilum 1.58]